MTALVLSGIPCDQFFFEGFLPRKHGERVKRLRRLASIPGALLFYESPHRAEASLEAIAEVFPGRVVALCRELTKLHEEVLRDEAPVLLERLRERGELKGEMVIVVAALCRELTKLHEEVLRDEAPVLLERLRERGELKGEMVIVVAPPSEEDLERLQAVLPSGVDEGAAADPEELLRSDIAEGLAAGDSANALAKRLAQKYSRKKRDVYSCCVRISPRASPPAIRQTRWPSAWRRSTRARSATCTTWCSKRSKRHKGRVAVHAPNLLIWSIASKPKREGSRAS